MHTETFPIKLNVFEPDFTREDCIISQKDGRVDAINYNLAIRQRLVKEEVTALVEKHREKDEIFTMMEETDDPVELRRLAEFVTNIYFVQQILWHFPQDPNYHQWWEMPKCTCPKMDNRDRIGTGSKVINGDCPIHRSFGTAK